VSCQNTLNWEVAQGVSHGHKNGVISVSFSPDGTWVVSGSNENTIRLWDAATGKQLQKPLQGHAGGLRWLDCVSFTFRWWQHHLALGCRKRELPSQGNPASIPLDTLWSDEKAGSRSSGMSSDVRLKSEW
jgi:WD40 repeat protein